MSPSPVLDPVTLPCGKVVPNRQCKVALYEHLANLRGGPPNDYHCALYEAWSQISPSWGMVFTGNVQVSDEHLSLGRDMTIPHHISDETLEPYKKLAKAIHGNGSSLAIMQLSHTGRQSSNIFTGRLTTPLAPSSIAVGSEIPWTEFGKRLVYWLLFCTPNPMSTEDIGTVVARFVTGAKVAQQSGFDGIQLHAAHGYLLAQFLSPKTNKRTDEYAITPEGGELRLLRTIIEEIRKVVPKDFIVGVKLNAGDYTTADSDDPTLTPKEERAMNHMKQIAQWGGVDFIEISGGDYEAVDFFEQRDDVGPKSAKPVSARQAFFTHISSKAISTLASLPRTPHSPPVPLILLTGGLKSPAALHSALVHNHAQLVGIGRAAVTTPNIPEVLDKLAKEKDPSEWPATPFAPDPAADAPKFLPKAPIVGASTYMSWYSLHMRFLAEKRRGKASVNAFPDYSIGGLKATAKLFLWMGNTLEEHPQGEVGGQGS